jgi:hypothetical protein
MRLLLHSASREQARVGDHRSVRGCSLGGPSCWLCCSCSVRALRVTSKGLGETAATLIASAVKGCHVGALCQLMEEHERRYVPQQKRLRFRRRARGYVQALQVDLPSDEAPSTSLRNPWALRSFPVFAIQFLEGLHSLITISQRWS